MKFNGNLTIFTISIATCTLFIIVFNLTRYFCDGINFKSIRQPEEFEYANLVFENDMCVRHFTRKGRHLVHTHSITIQKPTPLPDQRPTITLMSYHLMAL